MAIPDFGKPIQLPAVPEALRAPLAAAGERRPFSKGTVLYEEGFPCPQVPMLLSGSVRVYKLSESGREITLYRVKPGQICVLSSSCVLAGRDARLPAIAEAESEGELLAIPPHVFRRLLKELPGLQDYIGTVLTGRLADLMSVVDEVAFGRVHPRLAEMLAAAAGARPDGVVKATHAQLATELGTAREVVSRILKEFEHTGLVRLGRGRIEVLDPKGLKAAARGE